MHEDIKQILKGSGAIKFGDFELTNGGRSKYYIDVKKAATKPKTLRVICDHIVEKMKNHVIEPDYIACVELGGVPIGVMVSDRTNLPLIIVRKEIKDHGTKTSLVGDFEIGKTALLLEDVTTTGGSVLSAINALKNEGLYVDTVMTIVDRQEGADEALSRIGIVLIALTTARDILRDGPIIKDLKDIAVARNRYDEILVSNVL